MVPFHFARIPPYPWWTACAFPGSLCTVSLPSPSGPSPCLGLSHTPTPRPNLTACRASEIAVRLSPASSPLSFTSLAGSPVSVMEHANTRGEGARSRGPVHALGLPSAGIGYAGCSLPPSAAPLLGSAAVSPAAPGGCELDWLASEGRDARGSVPRRARRASGDAPYHLSAKRHLLDTSLPLMASFRCMLLTPQSGL